jgi:sugar lactone lactonase YvrE
MRKRFRGRLAPLGVLAAVVVVSAVFAATASAATVTTVVSGLDNPRGLAFSPNGQLYVAEAGHGGPNCFDSGPGPEGGTTCFGFTSQISRIDQASHTFQPVVTGLVSIADPTGARATGVDGISFQGNGGLYGIITESALATPDHLPGIADSAIAAGKAQLGRLIQANPSGGWKAVANVGDADYTWAGQNANLVPDQFPDANPYGVLALPGEQWVVDAGSNTIDRVDRNGNVRVEAFFPNPPSSDAVPTCVDQGPDGALYIGELTGGGNTPGAARVWRYAPGSGHPTIWATGLTAVTGCGFGADGNFYAVEFSTLGLDNAAPGTGALVRVPAGSSSPTVVTGGLSFPNGFAAGADGSLYFSNWSVAPVFAGLGSVLKVTP